MKSIIRLLVIASLCAAVTKAVAYNNTLTVANMTELQSLNVQSLIQAGYSNLSVFVQGYYAPSDRGGGMFKWDPNSSATVDWGRYFTTNGWTSGAGRWIRQLNGETANVKMWGAKGNWYPWIDYPGTLAHNDTTNIQNALTALGVGQDSDGNAPWTFELLFPAGTYKVTDTLVFNLSLVKLRGETVSRSLLMVPAGLYYKDILRSQNADQYIKGQASAFDEAVRIEDLGFAFEGWGTNQIANPTNACLVFAGGQEGFAIRDISVSGGAFGIRSFNGGNGSVLALRDICAHDATIAAVSIEPVPGTSFSYGQVSIHGITGDSRVGNQPGISSLIRFLSYNGVASIQDLNSEGYFGGGVIQHKSPPVSSGIGGVGAKLGSLTIRDASLNSATEHAYDFLVVTGEQQTVSVTMENIQLYNPGGYLIRDQLTGRNVSALDDIGSGTLQATCRTPIQYESYDYRNGETNGYYSRGSRLLSGDCAVYQFIPPTNGWYRIARFENISRVGGRMTITGGNDATEFSVEVPYGANTGAQFNIIRPTIDNGNYPPTVTMVRAGSYYDSFYSGGRGFVDMYVQRANQFGNSADTLKITYAMNGHTKAYDGAVPLLTPTSPVTSIVPATGTLQQCVTNSVTNLVTCCTP